MNALNQTTAKCEFFIPFRKTGMIAEKVSYRIIEFLFCHVIRKKNKTKTKNQNQKKQTKKTRK